MKIALIGATGFVGSALLNEALSRDHQVTAIVRNAAKLPRQPKLDARSVDVFDTSALAAALVGHDALIVSYSPGIANPALRGDMARGTASILAAARQARVPRLLAVLGAGSLEVAPGVMALDTPDFPAAWKDIAEATRDFFNLLRDEKELSWTALSPAFELAPGERTGKYRTGGDKALFDTEGKSRISTADYAVAMLDEVETPKHIGQRFSVAY